MSGPGSASRRTDGKVQPIRESDMDSPDLQYGDRKNLAEAQKIARVANRPSEQQRLPSGAPPVAGKRLPPWLFEGDSAFPNEPGTAGLDMGAGPGSEALMAAEPAPDEREDILQGLVAKFNSPIAAAMLQEMREQRAQYTASQDFAAATPTLGDPFAPGTGAPEGAEPPPEQDLAPLPESDVPTTPPLEEAAPPAEETA